MVIVTFVIYLSTIFLFKILLIFLFLKKAIFETVDINVHYFLTIKNRHSLQAKVVFVV